MSLLRLVPGFMLSLLYRLQKFLDSQMAWRQFLSFNKRLPSTPSNSVTGLASFSSKSNSYIVKVGIPEFLNGVGKGVEQHVEKLESEFGDLQKLLVARTIKLKRIGLKCQERKLILKYAHKYRLGLWRPRAEPVKS
ncbi:IGR protein motif [Abeliophyllum distichum]|uniref:IGR protein motif n=1 Tax=Abeliophyllum distichum TaxID=126358 RepID=A0ABD1RW46_9LAMI